ncbi:Phenylalanyl-tRNA synthetase beta chain [hydrothermal vent metagenome]|uniref:Phenylalanine--tRNA ligase beta subunit n=1 Tax=hydrothermal vent metagenome TaxID=652676 RepID=A0A3B1D6I9_9ZZZZ
MLVSYLWLKELVDFDKSPEDLAATLTDLGLECAIIDDRRGWYDNVVVGKIVEVTKHPNADKLSLCKVDIGNEVKAIVCGASNVAKEQLVPVALSGATLPGGLTIEKRKVRGEESDGMICAEDELELSDDHEGIMILEEGPQPGVKLAEYYELCDVVLEVDLTPNRGDCSSMIGVAREVAAITGNVVRAGPVDFTEDDNKTSAEFIEVIIDAPDLCPRYTGRVIKDVTIKKSPFWMRRRLMALGVRSINNIVDITNYILMETGHPLHAFDNTQIAGSKIIVRRAKEGEAFVTLDNKARSLTGDCLVIADAGGPVALAGVMGGLNSEVKESTKDIMLESAYFTPQSIRRTSRFYGISTESSYRFERGTDVEGLIHAQERATYLMQNMAGGNPLKGRVDAYPVKIGRKEVTLRISRIEKILGVKVPGGEVIKILKGLQMKVAGGEGDFVNIEVPYSRPDIEREIDLIEEVARVYGYGRIPSLIPETPASETGLTNIFKFRRSVRKHLVSRGIMEGLRNSFTSLADIEKMLIPEGDPLRKLVPIDNPLSSEWTHLRSTLMPGMISSSKGADDASIFEMGTRFLGNGDKAPEEGWMLSIMMTETMAPNLWQGRAAKRDFYHIKGIVESLVNYLGLTRGLALNEARRPYYYPKRQADIVIDGQLVGHMGQIHPSIISSFEVDQELFICEIDITLLSAIEPPVGKHAGVQKFPSIRRDLAIVVDEPVTIDDITDSIGKNGAPGAITCHAAVFDIFRGEKIGEGKKSVAFALEFNDKERTLTDEEIDRLFVAILSGLKADCGARLR